MKLKPIAEQVVVVFGASSGIGRETAKQFAARGAKVVVSARRDEALDTLVEEIRRAGGEATALAADTTDYEAVRSVADLTVERYGRIDTWVHLAAVSVYARFEDTLPEEFQQIIETNLLGQIYGAKAALPHLRAAGGGSLIHISSVEAERAIPYHSAYAASKQGVRGFVDALRVELAKESAPINVVKVMPASINTPFFDTARTRLGVKPRGIPPVYEPNVVADTILYGAEHPARDLFAGGAARLFVMLQRLSPGLADAVLRVIGFRFQKTAEPKSADAPSNIFNPVVGHDTEQGGMSKEARGFSVYTFLETHPAVRGALMIGFAAGTLALLSRRTRIPKIED
jgi:NAD(P)-dependent dehydrogenase (short-subunit alcohol dehydrogenase family)